MCGIFGYLDVNRKSLSEKTLKLMGDVIKYRGPDSSGLFSEVGVALGNQRLAIMDIDHGTQPFISDDGMVVVVQNGEIFNHVELASELENTPFSCQSHCDTEVILRLYEKHGIEFISKLNGMFAIAIWDKRDASIYLIRDRVGEKPLHYSLKEGRLTFASEIKSILASGIEKSVDFDALDSYLTFNYVCPPSTLFKGVRHVMPGTYLKYNSAGIETITWWDLSKIEQLERTEDELIRELNILLDDAVRIRLRSEVPFGAFLSGGVDSSSIVGLMSKHMNSPVRTYSIGFHDPIYDESPYAQEAANRFDTIHVNEKVEANLLGLWPKVTFHCDQPHGDVSFMPTLRVAELASRDVKMVLTGDGADELFAGYDKYKNFFSDNTVLELDDHEFRKKYLENISLFQEEDKADMYSKELINAVSKDNIASYIDPLFNDASNFQRLNQALFIDTKLLLPGNNLVKADRMGMAVSIENRAPFLDYRIIELAFSMPSEMKLKNNVTKYIYKKAVSTLVGENLTYRKKQMFTVPISSWLKHELKDMVNDLLFSERARSRNLFVPAFVESLYESHCHGSKDYTRELRALMALEIWFREFIDVNEPNGNPPEN